MRLLKTHPILGLANSYIIDSPQPANISYLWNFGSLLGACLGIQILTGVFLAMHYTPSVDLAFISVEHIMRDVNYGWLIRYLHANTASFFFIFVYLHIGRGLYYGSYKSPRILVWSIGVVILIIIMATAFLGFIGQKWICSYNIDINIFQYSSISWFITSNLRIQQFIKNNNIKPIIILDDLTNPNSKKIASKYLKPFSGIYIIVNLITGEYYIGSAIIGNLYMRFYKHLFSLTGNKRVGNAVTQYGLAQFVFLILEIVPEQNKENSIILIQREDHYLKSIKPEYNIAIIASNSTGWKHSEESINKIRKNYSEECKLRIGNINKGKTISDETKQLIRESAVNRKPISIESRIKCVVNIRPVTITNLDGSNPITFKTVKEASTVISCHEKTIHRALRSNGIIKNKYIVQDII